MTEQHVPVEDLAAYAAGDLDAAAAVTVEAHVLLCAGCRSDVDAVKAAAAALAAVDRPSMPADVAARLDAALAAEAPIATRAAAPAAVPATPARRSADVLPMRRRRPSFAGIAAVAAGVALIGAITIPLVTSGSPKKDVTAAREDAGTSGTRRLTSGLDYSRTNLAATLDRALAGVDESVQDTAAAPNAPGATKGRTNASPVPSPLAGAEGTEYSLTGTMALQTDVGRLAACITALVGDQPELGRTPLVVDFGSFLGRPAMVLVFRSVMSNGQERANRVDVYVVGAGCGATPGGDVLDFQRIARPNI